MSHKSVAESKVVPAPLLNIQSILLPFHIAWFETKVRYSRSVLGPFWITIQALIFIVAVGLLMGNVFDASIVQYMAYFSISYIMWIFLSSVVMESAGSFASAASFIKDRGKKPELFILVPFARQLIYLAHTIVIPIAIFMFFGIGSLHGLLMAIPGFLLFLLTALLLTAPVAMLCTRFRDGRPIVESAVNLLFLLSPILWPTNAVTNNARFVLSLNPLAHIIAAWREPLINGAFPWFSFGFALLFNAGLLALFIYAIRRSEKVSLWL